MAASTINARSETVHSKPAYRLAFKSRRCLVPVSGIYEWEKKDSKTKQPYIIYSASEQPLFLAGLWEAWKSSESECLYIYNNNIRTKFINGGIS